MKKILFVFFVLYTHNSIAQKKMNDTLRIHDVILSSGIINGKKVFKANEIIINKEKYDSITKESFNACIPCYLITLDEEDKTIKEGLFYINLPIGYFKSYHKNGKISSVGNYINLLPLSHKNLKMGMPCEGTCTVKDGRWKYYNDKGQLIKTEFYIKGLLQKVVR